MLWETKRNSTIWDQNDRKHLHCTAGRCLNFFGTVSSRKSVTYLCMSNIQTSAETLETGVTWGLIRWNCSSGPSGCAVTTLWPGKKPCRTWRDKMLHSCSTNDGGTIGATIPSALVVEYDEGCQEPAAAERTFHLHLPLFILLINLSICRSQSPPSKISYICSDMHWRWHAMHWTWITVPSPTYNSFLLSCTLLFLPNGWRRPEDGSIGPHKPNLQTTLLLLSSQHREQDAVRTGCVKIPGLWRRAL